MMMGPHRTGIVFTYCATGGAGGPGGGNGGGAGGLQAGWAGMWIRSQGRGWCLIGHADRVMGAGIAVQCWSLGQAVTKATSSSSHLGGGARTRAGGWRWGAGNGGRCKAWDSRGAGSLRMQGGRRAAQPRGQVARQQQPNTVPHSTAGHCTHHNTIPVRQTAEASPNSCPIRLPSPNPLPCALGLTM